MGEQDIELLELVARDKDRKLLESAAKAAGGDYDDLTGSITYDAGLSHEQWEPLEDDGDALRLAVDLHIVLTVGNVNVEARRWAGGDTNLPLHCQVEPVADDPRAAARRVIVRVAAEIGRAQ